ncbi:hypothetical protein P0Y35_09760 [Kiritimatiellaeota bacterium B1221]|nr:hypothetical protein [Kiritimatiellaeota bacterium B1221]
MSLPLPFQNSAFCWLHSLPPSRNQFVSFELDFEHQNFERLPFHLFADTRFRLYVNENFVAYGPGRFVTQFAEYDSFDLSAFLCEGTNRLRVEVNYYGSSSYQSMPDGLPGFIAAGGNQEGSLSFATPGNWRARVHTAWDPQSPLFSFAQNPAEILDTRRLDQELATAELKEIHPLPPSQTPWTTLRPRSAPYPDYQSMAPQRLLVASPVKTLYQRIGIQLEDAEFSKLKRNHNAKSSRQLTAWIYSEQAQSLKLETFWCMMEINGQPCELDDSSLQGNHGFTRVDLKAGWNFYSVNVEQLTEHWTHLLGWPTGAGLSLHARPDRSETAPWAVSPPRESRSLIPPPDSPDTFGLPEGWIRDSGEISRITPARLVAWMRPDENRALRDLPWIELKKGHHFDAPTAMWTLDFADQFYGHPVIEVEAPAGSILDVAYDDWKREDGCVNLYHSNPFTDAADRYILRGGRQIIEGLNPRGGIFMQVTLHTPEGDTAPLKLHNVSIRSRQLLKQQPPKSSFSCGDSVMDWAWNISTHTLIASTDEAYADCPWRERGSYIGDSLVNFHLQRLITSDLSIARRTFRMMGEGQHLSGPHQGQLASVTPAWHRKPHEDFTLIWIMCLRDYWNYTGDRSLLEETWPVIERIWDSPVWKTNEAGLWDVTEEMSPFIDWGVQKEDRVGRSNLLLNLFRLGALQATAEIERVLGRNFHSTKAKIASVDQALQTRLWQEDQGRFAPSDDHNSPCLHGQVLALAFGLGNAERLLKSIEPELKQNFKKGISQGQGAGHLELYFHIYLLPALAEMGRDDWAEQFIIEHFEYLKSLNYPTLNECFCRAVRGQGSCCHSWSGAPAIYASQNILGLRQREPGNPDAWIVDPRTQNYSSVSGCLPHAKGDIYVSWTRKENGFHFEIKAPEGVEVQVPASAR